MTKFTFLMLLSLFVLSPFISMGQDVETNEGIKPALLVIDVQNVYLPMMDQDAVDRPIDMINASVWVFNEFKLPIIYVYHQDTEGGPPADSKEFEFTERIPVPEDATKVIKHYGNAFNKTKLDQKLKDLGCNTVFLCGLSATGCVMSTYVGASDLDYNTFIIKDAVMSDDLEKTKMMEDILETISIQTLYFFLPNLK